jgi:hypothetical protein
VTLQIFCCLLPWRRTVTSCVNTKSIALYITPKTYPSNVQTEDDGSKRGYKRILYYRMGYFWSLGPNRKVYKAKNARDKSAVKHDCMEAIGCCVWLERNEILSSLRTVTGVWIGHPLGTCWQRHCTISQSGQLIETLPHGLLIHLIERVLQS